MSHMNNLQNKAPRPQFFKKILSRVGEARKKLCMYAVHWAPYLFNYTTLDRSKSKHSYSWGHTQYPDPFATHAWAGISNMGKYMCSVASAC
jgi:hypothetical protein